MSKSGPELDELLRDLVEWTESVGLVVSRIEDKDALNLLENLALARAVEICGEICGQILSRFPDWAADNDKTVLASAYRTRNRIIHGYDGVDSILLYEIAHRDVPRLHQQARRRLKQIDDQPKL